MRRFFEWYQFVIPVFGFPGMAWLWTRETGAARSTGFMLSLLVFSYVVPGLGTNVTRLYEFRTRFRVGRMRPHHGFVLSTFAAAAAWAGERLGGWLATALLCATLVTIYDAFAIKSGFIVVYNRPYFEKRSAMAVALDYAPVFFFSFGAVLGLFVEVMKSRETGIAFFTVWTFGLMVVPIVALSGWSYLRHGQSGLWPWKAGHA